MCHGPYVDDMDDLALGRIFARVRVDDGFYSLRKVLEEAWRAGRDYGHDEYSEDDNVVYECSHCCKEVEPSEIRIFVPRARLCALSFSA